MSYVRAFLFYLVMVIATVVHSTLCLIFASWLPFRLRFKIVSSVNHLFIGWLRLVCGVRYQLAGQENLPQGRPYVLLVNHQSEWETIYLQLLVQPISTVLKKELLRIPFFGWALSLLRPIAIDRSQRTGAIKQLLKQGKQRLEEGVPVVIFPQGTRVAAGQLGTFNKGGAMLACSAKVPVVPMVHNAGEHWPSGRFAKIPGLIRIEIGEPIATEGRSVDEVFQQSTGWIQSRLEGTADVEVAD